MTNDQIEAAIAFVEASLADAADPTKAAGMQAYMKTEMPFYGVQKAGRTQIFRDLVREFPAETRDEYEQLALALWSLPHREEKYLAQGIATKYRKFIVPASMSLYRRFIVEGAWWDFVDETATHMVRELIRNYPEQTWPVVDPWIHHGDMWLRRSAIICQVGLKEVTDVDRLFDFCLQRAHEKEFFIRKAIGWSLREYAKTDPPAVATFVMSHRDAWSGLSFREATRHIGHLL